MTLRGLFYIVAFFAFAVFLLTPVFESMDPFDGDAFVVGFRHGFWLGRPFGLESPKPSPGFLRGWKAAGSLVGFVGSLLCIVALVLSAIVAIGTEYDRAQRRKGR